LARHGRQGQKQDGVDIYGIDSLQNFVGVQCKNTTTSISTNIINSECLKAENFTPRLTALYIATTADRDVHIQAYARQLSEERRKTNKFPVEIVFWQDIIHDLSRDNLAIRQHYPQYFDQESPSPAQLMRSNDIQSLVSLLDVIDFQSISEHLSWGAKYINISIMEHLNQIQAVLNSPVFNIHDQALLNSINNMASRWGELTRLVGLAPYNLNENTNTLIFYMPGDFCRNREENDLFESIDLAIRELMHSIRSLCQIINTGYIEISLENTSTKARRLY